jgi:transcription elongation GreA/GreB family factor
MSVAFRRDCDEEHLEPKFELPIPLGPNLVTPRGLAQITARVAALDAAIDGEKDAAKLADLQRECRYWRVQLSTAQVATPDVARIGVGVCVTFQLNGAQRTIHIVGADEADPVNGYIAFTAPLARAMAGASTGDEVDFGGTTNAIEIIGVDVSKN